MRLRSSKRILMSVITDKRQRTSPLPFCACFSVSKGAFFKKPLWRVWAAPTTFYSAFLFAEGADAAPCHPERSKAESNFFLRDSKCCYAAFDPRDARISTALRMTRRKKRHAPRGGICFCISLPKRKSGYRFVVSWPCLPPSPYFCILTTILLYAIIIYWRFLRRKAEYPLKM